MKRSKHSLSHYKLLTFDQGELVPVGLVEVLPGDTVQQATSALIRVSPLLAPMMHPVRVKIHHWFVPFRLIWEDFEKFITGGPTGDDNTVPPFYSAWSHSEGDLADYFGLPPVAAGDIGNISALPFRAYAKIWNEYYRDQDLQTELNVEVTSGEDSMTSYDLQYVCWEKDYFTTSRPWTQKGTDIGVPFSPHGDITMKSTDQGATMTLQGEQAGVVPRISGIQWGAAGNLRWVDPGMQISINDLRMSSALQRFAEARAKFGSRYTEYLRSLGVRSRDSRLDRPEYLGGGRQTIQISEVLQTGTNYDGNTGVGSMKGHGIGAMRSNRYRRFFEEHGYIMTLMSVMPKTMYAQGVDKLWTRTVNEEFFQKELQHIGQAEVLNKEIYAEHTTPEGIFGYQDRYDEYRRMESKIAGEFRSTLNHWHMARIFSGDPALNASFVEGNPTKRMLASNATDGLYCMVNHSIQARRLVDARG